jgi:hypothetical protein
MLWHDAWELEYWGQSNSTVTSITRQRLGKEIPSNKYHTTIEELLEVVHAEVV